MDNPKSLSSFRRDGSVNEKSSYVSYLKKFGERKGAYGSQLKDDINKERNQKVCEIINNFAALDEKHRRLMSENRERRKKMDFKLKKEVQNKLKEEQMKLEKRKIDKQSAYLKYLRENSNQLITKFQKEKKKTTEIIPEIPKNIKPNSAKQGRTILSPIKKNNNICKIEQKIDKEILKKQTLNALDLEIKKSTENLPKLLKQYNKNNQDNYDRMVDDFLQSFENSMKMNKEESKLLDSLNLEPLSNIKKSPIKKKIKKSNKKEKKNEKKVTDTFYENIEKLNNKNNKQFIENLIGYESSDNSSITKSKREVIPVLCETNQINEKKKPLENNYRVIKTNLLEKFEEKSEKQSKFKSELLTKVKSNRKFNVRKGTLSSKGERINKENEKIKANLITINQEEIELQKELEILSSKQKNIICAKKQKNNQYYLQYDLQFQSNLKENEELICEKYYNFNEEIIKEKIEKKIEKSKFDQETLEIKKKNNIKKIVEVEEKLEDSKKKNDLIIKKGGYTEMFNVKKEEKFFSKNIDINIKQIDNDEGKIVVLNKNVLINLLSD